MPSRPSKHSVHHVYPLWSEGEDVDANRVRLDASAHVDLHATLDVSRLDSELDHWFRLRNHTLIPTEEAVHTQYDLREKFFKKFNSLPLPQRRTIWNKLKHVLLEHLHQYEKTTGKPYRYFSKTFVKMLKPVTSHAHVLEILRLDRQIMLARTKHLQQLVKFACGTELQHLTQPYDGSYVYVVPLTLRWRHIYDNQVDYQKLGSADHTLQSLYSLVACKTKLGKKRYMARKYTNGTALWGTDEWKKRWDVQQKYLSQTYDILQQEWCTHVWDHFTEKMHAQAHHDKNVYQCVTGTTADPIDHVDRPAWSTDALLDYHTASITYLWELWDAVRDALSNKYHFIK